MTEIPADRDFDGPSSGDYLDDPQSVVDGSRADDPTFWRIVSALLALVAVCVVVVISLGVQKWRTDQQIKQLPGVVVVESGATLVDYVVGGDQEDRLRLAIFAAERMKRPLRAVETQVAGRDKPLLGDNYRYGTSVPVTYDQARSLVAYSDSVKISMRIYPGDLLDPRRGEFISRKDPQAVLDYLRATTTCGSVENLDALNNFTIVHGEWARVNGISLHRTLNCKGRSSKR